MSKKYIKKQLATKIKINFEIQNKENRLYSEIRFQRAFSRMYLNTCFLFFVFLLNIVSKRRNVKKALK